MQFPRGDEPTAGLLACLGWLKGESMQFWKDCLEMTTMSKVLKSLVTLGMGGVALLAWPSGVRAEETAAAAAAPAISEADTAFMMISAALVMLMTPGLGLFYGGMVRRKNVLATFQQSFIMLGVIALQWVLFGYSLAFGPDKLHGLIGGLEWAGLHGVGFDPNPDYAPTIPHQLFMVYQLMFAVITPALISGAFAERMKFSAYLALHAALGDAGLRPRGALGLGHRRLDQGSGRARLRGRPGRAHHLGRRGTLLRAGDGQAQGARHRGDAPAQPDDDGARDRPALVRLVRLQRRQRPGGQHVGGRRVREHEHRRRRRHGELVADRVAAQGQGDRPGRLLGGRRRPGRHHPGGRVRHPDGRHGARPGRVAASATARSCSKGKLGYDDSLDVFGVHGVGGMFGALAVGVLATAGISGNPAGLLGGNPALLGKQAISVVAAVAYSFCRDLHPAQAG